MDTSCYCILDLLYVISCAILGHPILDENYVNPRQKSWEQWSKSQVKELEQLFKSEEEDTIQKPGMIGYFK